MLISRPTTGLYRATVRLSEALRLRLSFGGSPFGGSPSKTRVCKVQPDALPGERESRKFKIICEPLFRRAADTFRGGSKSMCTLCTSSSDRARTSSCSTYPLRSPDRIHCSRWIQALMDCPHYSRRPLLIVRTCYIARGRASRTHASSPVTVCLPHGDTAIRMMKALAKRLFFERQFG